MKKKIIHFTAIAIIILFGACSKDTPIDDKDKELPPETIERTISLSATLSDNNSSTPPSASMSADDPTTRVSHNDNGEEVEVRWVVGDKIRLAFREEYPGGVATATADTKVESISDEGNMAHFTINIPTRTIQGDFTLYGVYGGEPTFYPRIEFMSNNPIIFFPNQPWGSNSLNASEGSVQSNRDMVLYFEHEMKLDDESALVTFNHVGSLFSLAIKNTCDVCVLDVEEIQIEGVKNSNNKNWSCNYLGGTGMDMKTGSFIQTGTLSPFNGNYIKFIPKGGILVKQETLTLWGWYPTLTDKYWPELGLKLVVTGEGDGNRNIINPDWNNLRAKSKPTPRGGSFKFYAIWNGTELLFTQSDFTTVIGVRP